MYRSSVLSLFLILQLFKWVQDWSMYTLNLSFSKCYSFNICRLKENSIKGYSMRCLPRAGCLTGSRVCSYTLRECRFTMICWFGMQRESAISYTIRTTRLIGLSGTGENGLASITKAVLLSWKKILMIGEISYIFFCSFY